MFDKLKKKAEEVLGQKQEQKNPEDNKDDVQYIVPPGVLEAQDAARNTQPLTTPPEAAKDEYPDLPQGEDMMQPEMKDMDIEMVEMEADIIPLESLEEEPKPVIEVTTEPAAVEAPAEERHTAPLIMMVPKEEGDEADEPAADPAEVVTPAEERKTSPLITMVPKEEGYDFDASKTDLTELAMATKEIVERPGHELRFEENEEKDMKERYEPIREAAADTQVNPAPKAEGRQRISDELIAEIDGYFISKPVRQISIELPYTETGFLSSENHVDFWKYVDIGAILGADVPKEETEPEVVPEPVKEEPKMKKPSWIPSFGGRS